MRTHLTGVPGAHVRPTLVPLGDGVPLTRRGERPGWSRPVHHLAAHLAAHLAGVPGAGKLRPAGGVPLTLAGGTGLALPLSGNLIPFRHAAGSDAPVPLI